jgi:hypothetical protein
MSSQSRLAAVAWRWANVLLLAVVRAITFEVALPFAWNFVRARTIPFSPPLVALAALLATTSLFSETSFTMSSRTSSVI